MCKLVCVHSFILSSHIKWQYFLASSHLEWWCLSLLPILTCKNIRARCVSVSHNGETERSLTVCSEFSCFKLHQLWIWNWSLSSEMQIWANSIGLLSKLPQVLHISLCVEEDRALNYEQTPCSVFWSWVQTNNKTCAIQSWLRDE